MAVDSLVNLLLAEAGGKNAAERYQDMLHIASTVANRAQATGKTVAEIIGAPGEFSAWGKPLPPGVEKYSMLAQRAIEQVAQHGSVTAAQFYATPKATDNLPKGLKQEGRTAGHVYFSDPQGRAIETTGGYVKPMPINLDVTAALPLDAPRPYSPNTFQPQLVAPQFPDLGTVPARSVATTQVAPMSGPPPSVPAVPVTSRSITPGAGLANLAPNGIQERGTREGLSFIGDRQVFPGIGMGNLAPFNERAALAAGVEPGQFAFTPGNRGLYPASGIAQKVVNAANDVLPGVKTTLYSGQERKGQAPVGDSVDRHPRGYAGDFNFTKDGRAVSDPAFFQDLSLEMAARHDANIGYSAGKDYMGPRSIHIDTMPLGVGLPGGAQWGATANGWAPELQFARDAGRTLPGWGASRNDPIPTPMTREAALSLPAVPSVPGLTASPYAGVPAVPALSPTVPNFAGGLSPRGAQDIAPTAPQIPTVPSVPSIPGLNNFAPISPREAQEASMGAYRSSQSAIDAMISDRAGARGQAAPVGVPAAPAGLPAPAILSVPQSVIDAYQQYGQSRAAAPAAPVAAPQVQYEPQAVPAPQVSNEVVPALPPVAPVPSSSPRNAGMDFVRGGIVGGIPGMLLGPATSQIGRNVRSNARGEKIGLFKGIPQAYRNAFQGVRSGFGGMFGGVPSVPSPFSVGSGLSAIQAVMSGGLAPGATAYSVSHPGASWSVNGNGIAEFTSQHGFTGPVPDNW